MIGITGLSHSKSEPYGQAEAREVRFARVPAGPSLSFDHRDV